ncbi:MAG: hypothetical protein WED00_05500 [Aquisalimonadaceae bacterium]
MKRFHLAISVEDLDVSIREYSMRLGADPILVVPGRYALWRTPGVNFSIRHMPGQSGLLRHVGWEDPDAETLSVEHDVNGLVWERFSARDQAMEIKANWPEVDYEPRD